MRVVVTGATGHLGRLAADALVRRGIAASDIVTAGRNPDRLDALASNGFAVAPIDYDDPASLRKSFDTAGKLLLVASSEFGRRAAHHRKAIEAARDVGVGLIVYTSLAAAGRNSSGLSAEHRETEESLRSGGSAFVLLRNGWYMENFTALIGRYRRQGRIVGASGTGRISAATRADLADAAARVLTSAGHEGATYELGGDNAFTMAEFAAELSRQTGEDVSWHNMPADEYEQFLAGKGYPAAAAALWAGVERSLGADELLVDGGDLRRLIGRPPTDMARAIAEAIALPARLFSGSRTVFSSRDRSGVAQPPGRPAGRLPRSRWLCPKPARPDRAGRLAADRSSRAPHPVPRRRRSR